MVLPTNCQIVNCQIVQSDEVFALYVLEEAVCAVLDFLAGCFVAYYDAVGV